MKLRTRLIILSVSILISAIHIHAQERNWTHFRGNDLSGISDIKGLPVSWNDSSNINWKVAIEGKGWSSPVVYGNQVWCTSATPDGKEMFAVCKDLKTGESLFRIKTFEPDSVYRIHAINS